MAAAPDLALSAAAGGAVIVAAVLGRLALSRLTGGGSPSVWLTLTALAQAVAVAAFAALAAAVPEPTGHAQRAVIFAILVYAALHAAVGVILAAYGVVRGRTGRLSAVRSVDLRIGSLWHGYTAAAGLLALGSSVAFSLLAGVEPGR